jgi:flagellar basal body-associated protein FliL
MPTRSASPKATASSIPTKVAAGKRRKGLPLWLILLIVGTIVLLTAIAGILIYTFYQRRKRLKPLDSEDLIEEEDRPSEPPEELTSVMSEELTGETPVELGSDKE